MREADIQRAKQRVATYFNNAYHAREKGHHIVASQWEELARIEQVTLAHQIARDKQREESWTQRTDS